MPVRALAPHAGPFDLSAIDIGFDVYEAQALGGQLVPFGGEAVPVDAGPQIMAARALPPDSGPPPLASVEEGGYPRQTQSLARELVPFCRKRVPIGALPQVMRVHPGAPRPDIGDGHDPSSEIMTG